MAISKPTSKPAPEAGGSPEPEKPKIEKFSGVIEKVNENGKSIVVRGKVMQEEKLLTFHIDNKTKISKNSVMMTPGDLKKDMRVSIEYKKEKDKMIAVAIGVSTP
jgi:hypothetical protein